MNEPALPGRERRQKLRAARAADLRRGLGGQVLERALALRAESLGVESRVHGLADPFRGDPADEDLEPRQPLPLVGEQGLGIVADELEEDLVARRVALAERLVVVDVDGDGT